MKVDPGSLARAKNFAYRLLAYRERSVREIERRLAKKGFRREVSARVVSDLKALGYLNDLKFAKTFAKGRIKYNPSGLSLIRSKLYSKGVANDTVSAVISDIERDYDEYEAAYGIAKRRVIRFDKVDPAKAKRRIYDYLLRRRFKKDVIFQVLKKIFGK